jgi:hypothetical protein
MELATENTDDLQDVNGPSLEASSAHPIVMHPETLKFGECSPVEMRSTSPPSNHPRPEHFNGSTDPMRTAAIEGSSIPSTAKRVLLRFEHALPSPPSYPLETIDASSSSLRSGSSIDGMVEQTRSMTLIQKLRQSAFRRKMNPSIDNLSSSFSTTFPTDHSVRTPSLGTTEYASPRVLPSIGTVHDIVEWNGETEALPHTLIVGRLDGGGSLEILNPHSVEHDGEREGVVKSPSVSNAGTESEIRINSPPLPSSSEEETLEQNNTGSSIQAYSLATDSIPPPQSRLDHFAHSTLELGASSMAFMQQIRGAAFRRKKTLARSRDTFMEKERLHRQSIAQASEVARLQMEAALESQKVKETISVPHLPLVQVRPFKALPLPKTTGFQGSGGLSGVPKVPKRRPTIPKSPFLGSRRLLVADSANRLALPPNAASSTSSKESSSFKALHLPKSSLPVGGAGQSGVPKVPKRKVTVPQSPLLGPKRRLPPLEASANVPLPIDDDVSHHSKGVTSDDGGSCVLMGTEFHTSSKENEEPAAMALGSSMAYIPHSTRRAEQRAAFEKERAKNEQLRREAQRKERLQQVQMLQKELDVLRIEI